MLLWGEVLVGVMRCRLRFLAGVQEVLFAGLVFLVSAKELLLEACPDITALVLRDRHPSSPSPIGD